MNGQQEYPKAKSIALPLLRLLNEGLKKPAEMYERLADEFNLAPYLRDKKVLQNYSYWGRRVRWVFQDLKRAGLIQQIERSVWDLTEEGKRFLQNAKPGVVISVYKTNLGEAVWAECQDALTTVGKNSVQLCFTSPPYELTAQKEYGNLNGAKYVDWLADIVGRVRKVLKDDGSIVLNLGNSYQPGVPVMSLYQEKLILKLCEEYNLYLAQKFYWFNTAKLPRNQYEANQRFRCKDSVENLWWLSKTPYPYADNRNVLREYKDSHKRMLKKELRGDKVMRPSGNEISDGFYRDNGGAIPDNILMNVDDLVDEMVNFPSNILSFPHSKDAYTAKCKEYNLKPHPARFSWKMPEFFIKFLTRPGDIVLDIFGGSNVTGKTAEVLGRRWLTIEKSFHYIKTSLLRFDTVSVNPAFLG